MKDNPIHQALLDDALERMRALYRHPQDRPNARKSCYDGQPENTAIAFKVHYEYIDNTFGWDNRNDRDRKYGCPGRPDWYLNELNDSLYKDTTVPRGVHVFFTENARYAEAVQDTDRLLGWKAGHPCSQFPSRRKWVRQKVHYRDMASFVRDLARLPHDSTHRYWKPSLYFDHRGPKNDFNNTYNWIRDELGRGLAHEIGHSLNLHHRNSCKHHLMNSGRPGDYLMHQDIAEVHRALQTTSVRQYIASPAYHDGAPLMLQQSYRIHTAWRPIRDLVIAEGVTVKIDAPLEMPPGSTITVQPGGKLVVTEKGAIISAYDQPWAGIKRPRRHVFFGTRGEVKIHPEATVNTHISASR